MSLLQIRSQRQLARISVTKIKKSHDQNLDNIFIRISENYK